MGIRLIVEVMDHAPSTLTHREAWVLGVLAENANDGTRLTWDSVQDPQILHRARVSRSQMFAVLASLVSKGALEKARAGQKNGRAQYRFANMAAAQSPEIQDSDPHGQGPEIPDAEPPQGPETPDADSARQSPENRDADESQSPGIRDLRVPESGTPTPLLLEVDNSPAPPQPDPFDEFWAAYPRKVGKAYARTAWRKALKRGADPAVVTAAVPKHTAYWRATNTPAQYIPYPATWLNGERYDDEITLQPAAPQQTQQQTYADRGVF